jgi:signal transduction histidine kinase
MKSPNPEEKSMNGQLGAADSQGLHFLGIMTASISHELKNALAIINENAGLLGDLALLAEKGRPLDPERLKTRAEKIRQQVQRADDIIRRLNRFAHSAHEGAASTDVREVFEFTVALANRLAAMKSISLTVEPGTPVQLEVRPFQLENLLWLCLQQVFALAAASQSVVFAAVDAGADVVLSLHCSGVPVAEIAATVEREGQPLLKVLQASLQAEAGALRLTIPKKAGQSAN